MPFPFTLPTTSAFSFSQCFTSNSHPSLPLLASTQRAVLRTSLKKHKRLPPSSQSSNLSSILQALNNYIPYLLALDSGLSGGKVHDEEIDVVLASNPSIEWRATLSDNAVPGRESARVKIQSLEYEIYFVLQTLAYTYTLLARTALHPLYSSATASPTAEQRTAAIQTATKHLLAAASVHDYLVRRSENLMSTPPSIDISKSTFRALRSLALAEATLLAVLKDDPYPAAVAQDRNKNDKEWMIKAPDIPKVRAHLFARLSLAAAEHAGEAAASLEGGEGRGKVDPVLRKYADDVRKAGRGRTCRFFGIDAELGGKTGEAIAWCQAGLSEMGLSSIKEDGGKKGLGFGRLKKEWAEKREDRRVEKDAAWGSDGGRLEEGRVCDMLVAKWTKMNDTINTQHIPPFGPLLSQMPSGREIHSIKPYVPPDLDPYVLQTLRAPPDRTDDFSNESSDDEAESQDPVGAFPGTKEDYVKCSSSSAYY
ncbi:hypothetical protein F5884DRAFT_41631 [Xylogone sp. PMI_703]|nr:hypothetical protein F5884DRAFT_41631 [Xylogone sp. PMI_703]